MTGDERRHAMALGGDAFNGGNFHAAHEHWERVWLDLAGAERRWVQGLIQVAVALHKRARPEVCRALLHKGLAKLVDVPDQVLGLAAGALARDARALLEAPDLERRLQVAIDARVDR
jgi:predicted metal-dependent hydrolase